MSVNLNGAIQQMNGFIAAYDGWTDSWEFEEFMSSLYELCERVDDASVESMRQGGSAVAALRRENPFDKVLEEGGDEKKLAIQESYEMMINSTRYRVCMEKLLECSVYLKGFK